jgi:proline racemase
MGEFLACGFGGQALAVLPDEGKAKVGEMAVEQGQVGSRFHGGLVF